VDATEVSRNGDYVFPGGLATVHIDRDHCLGEYREPNILIIHPLSCGTAS